MITPFDEMLCHQLSTTFDHVVTSDPVWTERVVFVLSDKSGKVNLITGLARYANRNIIDAYAMVTFDSKMAHIVRVSRELRTEQSDFTSLCVGPYTYEILEPLSKIRATLEENDYGPSFQMDFIGDYPVYEQEPAFFRSRGRVIEDARRYYQYGKPSGWIKVDGKTYETDEKNWIALRDHSWGVRRGGGGGDLPASSIMQPPEIPEGVLYFMGSFMFEDRLVHFAVREDWEGKPWHFEGGIYYALGHEKEGEEIPVLSVAEHDFTFRPDVRVITSGKVVLNVSDGSEMEISIRPVGLYLPGPAGYDECKGYASGVWKGPQYIDGFKLDISELETLKRYGYLTEQICEVQCGKEVGYGNLEMVFVGKYPKYGYEGY